MVHGNSEKYFCKAKDYLSIDLVFKLELLTVDTRVILSIWNLLGKRQE